MGMSSSSSPSLRHGEWLARPGRLAQMKYDLAPLVPPLRSSVDRARESWLGGGEGLAALRTLLAPSRHAHVVKGPAEPKVE